MNMVSFREYDYRPTYRLGIEMSLWSVKLRNGHKVRQTEGKIE